MNNTEQLIQLTEQYRAQLTQATDRDTIRAKQEWFRQEAAPLFKTTGDHNTTQTNRTQKK